MFFKADVSLQTVLSESLTQKASRLPVYLISYADGPEIIYQNQHMLAASAQNKGIDVVINYRRSLLDSEFVKKHGRILETTKKIGTQRHV